MKAERDKEIGFAISIWAFGESLQALSGARYETAQSPKAAALGLGASDIPGLSARRTYFGK